MEESLIKSAQFSFNIYSLLVHEVAGNGAGNCYIWKSFVSSATEESSWNINQLCTIKGIHCVVSCEKSSWIVNYAVSLLKSQMKDMFISTIMRLLERLSLLPILNGDDLGCNFIWNYSFLWWDSISGYISLPFSSSLLRGQKCYRLVCFQWLLCSQIV